MPNGSSYHDAYRLGWETGAIYSKRNATTFWMATIEAGAGDYGDRRKAAALAAATPVTLH